MANFDGTPNDDTIDGGADDDYIDGGAGNDTLSGGDGDDTVFGWTGDDVIDGGAGNDLLDGEYGNDTVHGGDGDDQVYGWSGDDTLDGGAGNDLVAGEYGNDTLNYTLSENETSPGVYSSDSYSGGTDYDILCLRLTQSQYDYFASEILALQNFIQANANTSQSGGPSFTTSFGLTVDSVEELKLVIEPDPNTPPTLDLDAGDVTAGGYDSDRAFTEDGGPVQISGPEVAIADPDSGSITKATITLLDRPDGDAESLSLTALGQSMLAGWGYPAASYDPATGVLSIVGDATLADYEALLEQVVYDNSSQNPDTSVRGISFVVMDEYANSNVAFSWMSVYAVNDAPELTDVVSLRSFGENLVNAAPQVLDTDVTLSDVDSYDFAGGYLRISYSLGGGAEDQLAIPSLDVDGWAIGTLDLAEDGSGGNALRIQLNADATPARVEKLIERLTYRNTSDTPTYSRTIQIEVNDGDGGTSYPREIEIQVYPENEAPVLVDVDSPVTFAENLVNAAPQVLDAAVSLSDADSPDFDTGYLRISYSAGGGAEDQLSIPSLDVDGVAIGTFHAIDDGLGGNALQIELNDKATPTRVEKLIERLSYRNSSDDPAYSRTIRIEVNDGDGATSYPREIEIRVDPDNEAPVLTQVDSPVQFAENLVNAAPQVLDADVTLSDVDSYDFDTGYIRVTYAAGGGAEDQLSIPSLDVDSVTIGTLHATDDGLGGNALQIDLNDKATPTRVEKLIERLSYQNSSDAPTYSRTIRIEVNDGDGGTSYPREIEIQVYPENEAPVLLDVDSPVTFAENLVNAAPQVLDAAVSLSDADSPDFDTGYLRISYSAGGGAEDQLSIPSLDVDGVAIGTFHAIDDGLGGNALQIELNDKATPTRVEKLIERLSYRNSSDDPAYSRTIRIEVNDGDGATSYPREIEIRVDPENDDPILTDVDSPVTLGDQSVVSSFQILDADVTLTDADSPNFDTGQILVSYVSGGTTTDQLAIQDLVVDGFVIGSLDAANDGLDGSALRITLNDKATPVRVEQLIERLGYKSTAADPIGSRTIEIRVKDGDGGESYPRQIEIIVERENRPPILEDVGILTPFNEDMLELGPQLIDNNVTLTDPDSADFDGGYLLVKFLDGSADDNLGVNNEDPGPGTIGLVGSDVTFEGTVIGSIDPSNDGMGGANLKIFLNAFATPAITEALVENITFQNTNDDPRPTRTVRFLVNDGDGGTSDPDDVVIQILGVNDAPVLTDVDSPVVFDEQVVNAAPQVLDADVTLVDPDSYDFDGGYLRVTYSMGGGSEDQLSVPFLTVDGVLIGSIDSVETGADGNALRILFNSDATPSRVERLIETLSYANSSDTPAYERQIAIVVNDGDGGTSDPRYILIKVNQQNDAPKLENVAAMVMFEENVVNAAPQLVDSDVSLRDDDSPNFDTGFLLIRGSALPEDQLALSSALAAQVGTVAAGLDGSNGSDLRVDLDARATPALVEQLIESLTYRNTSDTPTEYRTIYLSVNDGDGGTSYERPVQIRVKANNDAPVLAGVDSPLTVLENAPATVVDGDVMLTDADSSDFAGGSLRIAYTAGGGAEDQLVIPSLMVDGVSIGSFDPTENGLGGNALTILLNGDATATRVEQLIERLTYQNSSEDPAASRTISIVVDDNDGGSSPSVPQLVVINVTPVNDAPVLADVVASRSFDENTVNAAPQVLDPDVSLSDVDTQDFGGGYVLVTYALGGGTEDQLSVPNLMIDGVDVAVVSGTETGVNGAALRLLLQPGANRDRVERLIETLSYRNTSDAPAASRTIEITVNDGEGTANGGIDTSAPRQIQILVNEQNDAPQLEDLAPVVTFQEMTVNAAPQVIDATLRVIDDDSADFLGGELLIRYAVGGGPEDQLDFSNELLVDGFMMGSVVGLEDGTNGAGLRIALNVNATTDRIERLLETLRYQNTSDDPALSRTLEITLSDGDGGTSTPDRVEIRVHRENDAPRLEDVDPVQAFAENGPAQVLDPDVLLMDVDSPDFNGGFLQLEYVLGGGTEDQLNLPILEIDGVSLGTLISDGSNGTTLRVNLNGNATPDRVERLIETITYQNTSEAPQPERTLRITVNDGDGGTSDPRDILIKVAQMNDPPILTQVGEILVLNEDAVLLVPAFLDSNVTVTSLDGEDLGGGHVLIDMAGTTDDQLGINDEGTGPDQIGFDGVTVTYEGVPIGTVSLPNDGSNGSDLRIDLLLNATVLAVEALIENVNYQNISNDPQQSRLATITITDNGGLTSDPRQINILIAAVNDLPEVAILNAMATFLEDDFDAGLPLPVGIDASIADPDSADFAGGTLLVTGSGLPEDEIGFPDLMGLGAIVGADDGGMGRDLRILLNGNATPTTVANLLDTLQYRNSSQDPTGSRTLQVTVSDGDGGTSLAQAVQIQVVPVNDAPVVDGVVTSLAVAEGDPATLVDPAVMVTDVDSQNFAGGFLRIEYVAGGGAEDQLAIPNLVVDGVAIGVRHPVDTGVGGRALQINLDSDATPARVEVLIERLTYQNTSMNPQPTRTIRITVNDGDGTANGGQDTSAPRDVTITVDAANDDPTLVGLGPDATFLENAVNAAPQPVDMTLAVADVDSANFAGGMLRISGSGLPEDTLAFSSMLGIGSIDAVETGAMGTALKVTFNAAATPAQVQLLLQSLVYSNSSDTPTVGPRNLTVDLSDGDGGSVSVPLNITVTPENDAPQILDFVAMASFDEMGPPTPIDSMVDVIDPDLPASLDGGFLLIRYTAGQSTFDQLNLPSLVVDGMPIGSFAAGMTGANGTDLRVDLGPAATPARVATLLETLTYNSTAEDPALQRTIQIVVDDGTGTPNSSSLPHTVVLNVAPVNDAPLLDGVAPLVVFQENVVNLGPQSVGLNVSLSDVDSDNFLNGTLLITGSGLPEDSIAVDLMGLGSIVGTSDGGMGRDLRILLNAGATPASVKALIDSLTYANDSDRPTLSRTLMLSLTEADGTASMVRPLEIQVDPVNDSPVLESFVPSASFLENAVNAAPQSLGLDVSVTDVDSDDFAGGQLIIGYLTPSTLADQLILPSLEVDGVVIGAFDPSGTGQNGALVRVNFNAEATPARVETLIETLAYRNTSSTPAPSRTIGIVLSDGDGPNSLSEMRTFEILIQQENDAPELEDVGILKIFNEQDVNAAQQFIDNNVTLSDDDSPDLMTGEVTVRYVVGGVASDTGFAEDQLGILDMGTLGDQIGLDGSTITYGGVPFATLDPVLTGQNGLALRIFISQPTSAQIVEALVEALTYQNSSDTPQPTRFVRITVTDDTGLTSLPRDVEIRVTPANDAPVLENVVEQLDVVENDPATLVDPDVMFVDPDLPAHLGGGNLMIVYSAGGSSEDQLALPSLEIDGGPIGSYELGQNGANGLPIKVLFNTNATPDRVERLLETLTYRNGSEDPQANRTISITVTDDLGATSMAQEVQINVESVNDLPRLENVNDAQFTELQVNTAPQVIDADVMLSDPDFFQGGYVLVEYAGGGAVEETLSVLALTIDGVVVATIDTTRNGQMGADLLLNLTADATPALVERLIEGLTYANVDDTPDLERTLTITVNDGIADAPAVPVTITVTQVNDAPVLADLVTERTFTEQVVGVIDYSVAVSDVDSPDFDGGFLLVEYTHLGALPEDQLSIQNQGMGMGQVGFDGTNVTVGGVPVGQVDGTFSGSDGRALRVGFNINATPERVERVVESVTYLNTSDAPAPTRTVRVTLDDGDGNADGGMSSVSQEVLLRVEGANDAPVLGPIDGPLMVTEGDPATTVDATLSLSDADSPDLMGGEILITYAAGGGLEDQLAFPSLMVDGVVIADSVAGSDGMNGAELRLSLRVEATPDRVERLLETLTYRNSSDDPAASRTLSVTVSDGDGGTSLAQTVDVQVAPVNDAPSLEDLLPAVVFDENLVNAAPQTLDMALRVIDPDSDDFAGGHVTISYSAGGGIEDQLSFATLEIDDLVVGTVAGGQNGMNGSPLRVDFTPNATPDRVERLLQGLQYQNTSDTPAPTRTLSIVIDDGDPLGTSTPPDEIVVIVNAENDAPVLAGVDSPVMLLEEDVNAAFVSLDTDVALSDVDTADLVGGFIRVEYTAGASADDDLRISDLMGIGTLHPTDDGLGGNPLQIDLGAGATPAMVEALLEKLQYRNESDAPAASRTIEITVNDGVDLSVAQPLEIQIQPANDAPLVAGIDSPITLAEQDVNDAPQPILDAGVMVSDPDSPDFAGGYLLVEYLVGGGSADETLVIPNLMGIGSVNPADDGLAGNALQIDLTAGSTPDMVEALLETLRYANVSDTPAASRTLRITVNDGEIDDDTSVARDLVVDITPYNDAPIIAGLDSPPPFLENTVNATPQLVDMDVSVTDPDTLSYAGGRLLLTYQGAGLPEDQLALTPSLLGIGTVDGANNGTNGADLAILLNAAATPAQVEALLETLTYQNSSDTPTATRTLQVTLTEADLTASNTATAVITVTEENDAPTLGGAGGTIVFSESDVNATPQIIDSNVNVADPDSANFDGGAVIVTYEAGGGSADERLSVREGPSGLGMVGFSKATGIVTVDGIQIGTVNLGQDGVDGRALRIDLDPDATPARVERLIERITYQNVSDDPTPTRTVRIRVEDDRGGMSGPLDTTIQITPENDAPVLSQVDTPLNLVELSGVNVPATRIDASVALSDADTSVLEGGFVRVEYVAGGGTAEETLSVASVGMGIGEVGFDGTNVSVGGVMIGSLAGGSGGTAGAPLQIDLNAAASVENVRVLIEHLTYANNSDDPAASRTVAITVNDGGDDSGNPAATSTAQNVVINIAPDNDAPTIPMGFEDTVMFTEGAVPVVLDPSVTLDDPDSPDFGMGEVLLSYSTPTTPADQLGVLNQGIGADQIGFDGTTVTYMGTAIGSVDVTDTGRDGNDLRIAILPGTTRAQVERLLESLTYQNTSEEPVAGQSLQLTVSDGDGGSTPPVPVAIAITELNDLPVVDLSDLGPGTGFSNTFTEDQPVGASVTGADVVITDLDAGDRIASATLRFSTLPIPDAGAEAIGLDSVGTMLASGLGITPVYDAGTGTLTLSGPPTTRTNYQLLLARAIYTNSAQAPTPGVREILVSVNDGTDESAPASSLITVVPQPDAPEVDLEPGGLTPAPDFATSFSEGSAAIPIADLPTVVDVDGDDIMQLRLTLSNVMDGPAETLTLTQAGLDAAALAGIAVMPYNALSGVLLLQNAATPAEYAEVLAGLRYSNTSLEPNSNSTRTVTVVATDSTGLTSDPAMTTIDIVNVNDAPVLDLDSTAAPTGFQVNFMGQAVPVTSMNVDISDVDDNAIESATLLLTLTGDVESLVLTTPPANLPPGVMALYTTAGGVGTLTITGTATLAQYESLLEDVVYRNDSPNPTLGSRFVTIRVNDGDADSDMAITTITVQQPVLLPATAALADLDMTTAGWGSEATFLEGALATSLTGQVEISDADGGTSLAWASVTLMERPDGVWENVGLTPGGEFFAAANGVTLAPYDPTSGQLMLFGTADHSVYEVLLQSLVYSNTAANATGGMRNVEVVVHDGELESSAVSALVDVIATGGAAESIALQFETPGWVRAYAEGGVRVESLGDSANENLYLNDNNRDGSGDLLQIQNGGPYEISMGGAPFDLLSVDVVQNFGAGTFTASSGASVAMTPGTGTFEFGSGFQGVTWVQWNVTSGLAIIDNLQVFGSPLTNLSGSEGNDLLRGTAGDDVIDGLGGDDILEGGDGDDHFVFDFGSGSDRVEDFTPGAATPDVLDLSGRGFASAAEVLASATPDGADVLIDLGGGDEVRLVGVELSALHGDDFIV